MGDLLGCTRYTNLKVTNCELGTESSSWEAKGQSIGMYEIY